MIWVPTGDAMVTRLLEMAAVTPADKVYDLGAGDGKIAIAAAKDFGATSVGVEYEPAGRYILARWRVGALARWRVGALARSRWRGAPAVQLLPPQRPAAVGCGHCRIIRP